MRRDPEAAGTLRRGCMLLLALTLVACGSSEPVASGAGGAASPGKPVRETREGTVYRQAIQVSATGDTQVFQVFEPSQLEAGRSYPLVLQGHGYGGARNVRPDAFQQKLRDAGYYVISIDQRGFGESSGTVRAMSPDHEGQDLIAILDWAENLEGLRRRADGSMVVGSYGGSYGGLYQYILANIDPRQRLRVIAPDVAPHDIGESLNPRGVFKSAWALVLATAGEAGAVSGDPATILPALLARSLAGEPQRQDPAIYEALAGGVLDNTLSPAARNFFHYHSPAYFCEGQPAGPQDFVFAQPDPIAVPPSPFPRVDALITQGTRDALFNLNAGYLNYRCLRRAGGDVRLLTHEAGHILPVSLASVPALPDATLEDTLDPFYQALNLPSFQDAIGDASCGATTVAELRFAWFEEKLQGRDSAGSIPIGRNEVCQSLGPGDAIVTREFKQGGRVFAVDDSLPQFNSVLGIGGALLGSGAREALLAIQPLLRAPAGGLVVAGFPKLAVTVAPLSGTAPETCAVPLLPAACDPILFLAVGHRKAGQQRWDVIDDQLTPLRGFGPHEGLMAGIGERLAEGDELALLVYAFHAQYPITWSRDLFVPALGLGGSFQLPLLEPSEILREGI